MQLRCNLDAIDAIKMHLRFSIDAIRCALYRKALPSWVKLGPWLLFPVVVGWVEWLEKLRIKLSQLSTMVEVEVEAELGKCFVNIMFKVYLYKVECILPSLYTEIHNQLMHSSTKMVLFCSHHSPPICSSPEHGQVLEHHSNLPHN